MVGGNQVLADKLYHNAKLSTQADFELLHTDSSIAISKLKNREDLKWCGEILSKKAATDSANVANWINLSTYYLKVPDPGGAIMAADRALEINPANPDAACNKSVAYSMLGNTDREIFHMQEAAKVDPSRDWQCAMAEMKGELLSWKDFSSRYSGRPKPITGNMLKPIDHSSGGSVLVAVEQGLGDLIMMARYIIALNDCGFDVTVYSSDAKLCRFVSDVLLIKTTHNRFNPNFDYIVNLMDLLEMRSAEYDYGLDDPEGNYIKPITAHQQNGKIGLNFTGNPKFEYEYTRGIYDSQARINIEKACGGMAMSLDHLRHGTLQEFVNEIYRFDAIVTTDTMTAHLAGALGVPCLCMLSMNSDWRWDYPWYMSVSAYQQERIMDWSDMPDLVSDFMKEYKDLRFG